MVKTSAGVLTKSYRQEEGDVELTGIPQGTARIMATHTLVPDMMIEPYKKLVGKNANYFVMISANGFRTTCMLMMLPRT